MQPCRVLALLRAGGGLCLSIETYPVPASGIQVANWHISYSVVSPWQRVASTHVHGLLRCRWPAPQPVLHSDHSLQSPHPQAGGGAVVVADVAGASTSGSDVVESAKPVYRILQLASVEIEIELVLLPVRI